MKYILKYSYYIIIALIITLIMSLVINGIRLELIPMIVCILYILRFIDDYIDFDKDTKEKILSKKSLGILGILTSILYVFFNVLFYKIFGLFSIIFVIYILIENKFEILKIFLFLFSSVFYISRYTKITEMKVLIYLVVIFILSCIYYVYKRRKNK